MRLTKATYSQLDILILMHERAPACVPVSSICDALDLTGSIGLKLVNRLVHTGLLSGKRGPGGGVTLAKPSSDISIGAVIRELEAANRVDLADSVRTNRASRFIGNAFDCFLEVLDNFTLQDLAGGRSKLEVTDGKARKLRRGHPTFLVAVQRDGA